MSYVRPNFMFLGFGGHSLRFSRSNSVLLSWPERFFAASSWLTCLTTQATDDGKSATSCIRHMSIWNNTYTGISAQEKWTWPAVPWSE